MLRLVDIGDRSRSERTPFLKGGRRSAADTAIGLRIMKGGQGKASDHAVGVRTMKKGDEGGEPTG